MTLGGWLALSAPQSLPPSNGSPPGTLWAAAIPSVAAAAQPRQPRPGIARWSQAGAQASRARSGVPARRASAEVWPLERVLHLRVVWARATQGLKVLKAGGSGGEPGSGAPRLYVTLGIRVGVSAPGFALQPAKWAQLCPSPRIAGRPSEAAPARSALCLEPGVLLGARSRDSQDRRGCVPRIPVGAGHAGRLRCPQGSDCNSGRTPEFSRAGHLTLDSELGRGVRWAWLCLRELKLVVVVGVDWR